MGFFNDLKKIFFGAKAVTKSAAEKTVDATKEAGSDLWAKVQGSNSDTSQTSIKRPDLIMDKTSSSMNDGIVSTERPDTEEVMDAIIAERKAADQPTTLIQEETLQLPPLQTAADTPKLLDDGIPDNNRNDEQDNLDALKNTSTAAGATIVDKSSHTMENLGDFASKVGEKVIGTGSKLTEKFGETAESIGEAIFEKGGQAMDKAGDFASMVGSKVIDAGEKFTDKFGETAEQVGETIFEKGGEALDKAKNMAAGLGAKILAAKDELMTKAQAEADISGESTSSLIDKAKELNKQLEDKISGNNAKYSDKPLTTGGSEFAKHDSFWEKADKFSKGDYQMKEEEDHLELGELKITENKAATSEDKDKKKDDLIDDAIVEG